ncbi:hypothetical protein [Nocardia lijiangensis]|nr:hypothetical protein [Nocardia lijiangensis]
MVDNVPTRPLVQALLAPASPVIVTGGNSRNGVSEAQAMAEWLIAHPA